MSLNIPLFMRASDSNNKTVYGRVAHVACHQVGHAKLSHHTHRHYNKTPMLTCEKTGNHPTSLCWRAESQRMKLYVHM